MKSSVSRAADLFGLASVRKRISIFAHPYESLNLLLPLLFIGPVLYFVSSAEFESLNAKRMFGYFLSGAIFLNWVHTTLTLGAFIELQSFRSLVREKSRATEFYFPAKLVMVYFGFLAFSLCFYFPLGKYYSFIPEIGTDRLMNYLNIYGIYHVGRQTQGLSLLYNRRLEASGKLAVWEWIRLGRADRIERALFWIWIGLQVASATIGGVIPIGNIYWFDLLFRAKTVLAGLLVLNAIFLVPKVGLSNKLLYLCRLLVLSIPTNPLFSVLFLMSIHGVEYYFITRTFFDHEKVKCRFMGIGRITCVLAGLHTLMWLSSKHPMGNYFYRWFFENEQKNPVFIFVIGAMAATTHLFHFYLDGVLFRFKDPAVRKWIGPLLAVKPETSESSSELKVFCGPRADPKYLDI